MLRSSTSTSTFTSTILLWSPVLAAAFVVGGVGGAARASGNYVGAQRCQACHPFEYATWLRGPHARAHKSLKPDQLKDTKCNQCHTMVPEDLGPRFLGVQCEQCHGGGKYYHPDFVMKDRELSHALGLVDVKAEHCQQCHTLSAPSIEPFDFAKLWARIDHSKARRLEWEKSQSGGSAAPPRAGQ